MGYVKKPEIVLEAFWEEQRSDAASPPCRLGKDAMSPFGQIGVLLIGNFPLSLFGDENDPFSQ